MSTKDSVAVYHSQKLMLLQTMAEWNYLTDEFAVTVGDDEHDSEFKRLGNVVAESLKKMFEMAYAAD